ncbi:MAG: DUF1292 domain-containing protein [Lachnospiraceae bacterium]|nr:DUF1292 domain-containing protein [Lachnospiraceae bacterium]MDD3661327.1 DUF1292 domain-containing protein [Lachnospiraceae bacterium]
MVDREILKRHDTMTLTLDNDVEMKCQILTILEADGKEYLALLPEIREDDGEVYLYGVIQIGEDELELRDITDKEELEKALDAFDAWYESI